MLKNLQKYSFKAGSLPESFVFTGEKRVEHPIIIVTIYDKEHSETVKGMSFNDCLSLLSKRSGNEVTWISVAGLQDTNLIEQIGQYFGLHSLAIEDILNPVQRPKIDEYENYSFMILKTVFWSKDKDTVITEQVSLMIGNNFVLSFQESHCELFEPIYTSLNSQHGHLRTQGSNFLLYLMIDLIVDQYFVVLEALGEQIEDIEDKIISSPTKETSYLLYSLKNQFLIVRKASWPLRDAINKLLHLDFFQKDRFTMPFLQDSYQHMIEIIDYVETYRDMITSLFDIYLSSLSMRMNEIIKVLTIIATIFIPLTFIASIYGMNFYIPEVNYRWGYPIILVVMLVIALAMLYYFKRKKWL